MSVQQVPTYTDAYYTEVVTLEGTDYLLQFDYSPRESCYYMSIATPDGADIVSGIKIVSSWPLIYKYADPRLPPGELMAVANTGATDPAPGLGQIGQNLPFTLIYFSSNQLFAGGGNPAVLV